MTLVQDAPARQRLAPARMAWRSLLVHVQPETQAHPRLEVAADLARRLDAHLAGLGAEMLPPMAATDPYGMLGGEFVMAMEGVIESNVKGAAAAFKEKTKGLKAEFLSVQDFPTGAMSRLSRAADLIIAGGSPLDNRDKYRWCDPAELALQCGRPVLVAPPGGGELQAKSVVVAWKDTREARRALADSLPILKCADDVVVLAVCAKDEVTDTRVHTRSVLEYLLRHGVEGRSRVVAAHGGAVASTLQAEADASGADLIVAGAYGHTRVGEWVFGGATIDLLQNPRRFLLISH